MTRHNTLGLGGMPEHLRERFTDYLRSAALINQHPIIRRCDAVHELVNVSWYEQRYFPAQSNMLLVREKPLPGELVGLVARRNVQTSEGERGLFVVQVRPIANRFTEHFVIAHELGHVLAHGRLMYPGMVVAEPRWDASQEQDLRRKLLELEANLYALLSIVPAPAIDALRLSSRREISPAALQQAMQWLGGDAFDLQLARERLFLHQALTGRVHGSEFSLKIGAVPHSWTFNGADLRGEVAEGTGPAVLTQQELRAWLRSLCERQILNARYWPRVGQLLNDARPAASPDARVRRTDLQQQAQSEARIEATGQLGAPEAESRQLAPPCQQN